MPYSLTARRAFATYRQLSKVTFETHQTLTETRIISRDKFVSDDRFRKRNPCKQAPSKLILRVS